ncbi:MAG: hypothetical protein U0V74_14130 [Chitinophagales bacterium]
MKVPAFVFLMAAVLFAGAQNDSAAVINNSEDYYSAISLDSTLQHKEKGYEKLHDDITERGKLTCYYKHGKLVLLVNSSTDGVHCYEDVAYAVKGNKLVFVEDFRQCSFQTDEGSVESYTDERNYFKNGKLRYLQSGIGPDEEGEIKYYTAPLEQDREQKIKAEFEFWKAFFLSPLSYADFEIGWNFKF